ncbi:MAG: RNA polymerase sigma factor [Candidatus Eremiobacteraeota bacterium]|nr:RNA polymerase sigma factor [Candidatus Eremiobacteraeota bacterium]
MIVTVIRGIGSASPRIRVPGRCSRWLPGTTQRSAKLYPRRFAFTTNCDFLRVFGESPDVSSQSDRAAFTQLLQQHAAILQKVARAYCPAPDQRPDLVQEIAVALWRSYGRYDPSRPFSTWMYRIALNVAISFFRRESRHGAGLVELDEAAPLRSASTENARVATLLECIEELQPLEKALMVLHLDGYNYAEIAEIVGITQTNAATKISRMRKRLRAMMDARFRTQGERTDGTR